MKLPSYTVWEVTETIQIKLYTCTLEIKEGTQIMEVDNISYQPLLNKLYYIQGQAEVDSKVFNFVRLHGGLKCIAAKGSETPISKVHPSIIKYYQEVIHRAPWFTDKMISDMVQELGKGELHTLVQNASLTLLSLTQYLKNNPL